MILPSWEKSLKIFPSSLQVKNKWKLKFPIWEILLCEEASITYSGCCAYLYTEAAGHYLDTVQGRVAGCKDGDSGDRIILANAVQETEIWRSCQVGMEILTEFWFV